MRHWHHFAVHEPLEEPPLLIPLFPSPLLSSLAGSLPFSLGSIDTVTEHPYGKNLTFKTGGVDGCKCGEILSLIEQGRIDTTPLITHTYPLRDIAAAYELFENRRDGVIKAAVCMEQ